MDTAEAAAFEQTADETGTPEADNSKESRFGHFAWPGQPADAFATEDEAAIVDEQTETVAEETSIESESEQGVEEDTEAFLEKVFSQLDGNGNGNGKVDVEEEGHGLLRRRRMGSVLKEIDED
jgi:hypothetical protein